MHWLDPSYLPVTTGTVHQFVLNPHGDADGMIFTCGTEVHFPPHMAAEICAAIHPGQTVKVHGVKPRAANLIAAVSVESPAGEQIVDNGPPGDEDEAGKKAHKAELKPVPMDAEGVVKQALHGPKGETHGALLEDGIIIRFPPDEAAGLSSLLKAGAHIAVKGDGLNTKIGTVIDAREIGGSKDRLRRLQGKKPNHDKKRSDDRNADLHRAIGC